MEQNGLRCDLHTHSIYSDGTKTPGEIIEEGVRLGLSAVALTDHNTVRGLADFAAAAKGRKIKCVPGVEISTDDMGRDVHIVGLFLREECYEALENFMEEANQRKNESTRKMIEALKKDGYRVDYDEILSTHAGRINRAVVAAELLKKGYISQIKDAFRTLLREYGPYYTPPERISAVAAVEFLASLGAVSVLAHPYLTFKEDQVRAFLKKAEPHGLTAMETRYSTYTEEVNRLASETAREFGLLESGGSDDHGGNKPHIQMGSGMGGLFVPHAFYKKLAERAGV